MDQENNPGDIDAADLSDDLGEDTAQVANVAAIAAQIADAAPTPSEGAIEAHAGTPAGETPAGGAGPVDADGNTFDPELHVVDDDGKPKLTARGKLTKKRGRKKGQTARQNPQSTIGGIPGSSGSQNELLTPAQKQQAAATGTVAASLLINVSMMVGGDSFAPRVDPNTGIDEKMALESGFTDYFIATGKTDLPPGWALVVVIGMYMLPRFTEQKVQTRIKSKFEKIGDWWRGRKLRKQRERDKQTQPSKKDAAQSNPGNDGKRENDTSEKPSE